MNVVLLLYDFYWNCVVVLYKLPLLKQILLQSTTGSC
jgi:hypothetical protein